MGNVKTSQLKENLKVFLTVDEIREAGSNLARSFSQISTLEEEKKSAASNYKARIDALSAQAMVYAGLVQNGYDFREVDCEEIFDYDQKLISVVRMDTGETVRSRVMTARELQQGLFESGGDAEGDG